MRSNKKFLTLVISAVLVSAAVLGTCIYFTGNSHPSSPYNPDGVDSGAVNKVNSDAPVSQADLQAKFDAYNSNEMIQVDDVDGAYSYSCLRVFSEEQAAELMTKRQNGERVYLTYDEILFIINDSIRMYNSYDYVFLTDAQKNGITVSNIDVSKDDEAIKCYHGDYSELTYLEAQNTYTKTVEDILSIIRYRIYMHDTRAMKAGIASWTASGVYRAGSYPVFEGHDSEYPPGFVYGVRDCILLVLDEGALETEEEHVEILRNLYTVEYNPISSSLTGAVKPTEYNAIAIESRHLGIALNNGAALNDVLFPTAELEALRPKWELKQEYFNTDRITVSIAHNGYSQEVMTIDDPEILDYIFECLGDADEIAKIQNEEEPIYLEDNEYYYVLDMDNSTEIYIPADEKYQNAAFVGEAMYRTSLSFTHCVDDSFTRQIRAMAQRYAAKQCPPGGMGLPEYNDEWTEELKALYAQVSYAKVVEYNELLDRLVFAAEAKLYFSSSIRDIYDLDEYKAIKEKIENDIEFRRQTVKICYNYPTYFWSEILMTTLCEACPQIPTKQSMGSLKDLVDLILTDPEQYLK